MKDKEYLNSSIFERGFSPHRAEPKIGSKEPKNFIRIDSLIIIKGQDLKEKQTPFKLIFLIIYLL